MTRHDRPIGWRWLRWRKRELAQPSPAPAWPTDQTRRPTWATEQQQLLLPVVEPVIRECDG